MSDYRNLLGNLTFKLRNLLGILKGETLVLGLKGGTPPEIEVWMRRWTSAIDVWSLAEQQARVYTRDSRRTRLEWEDAFGRLGKGLEDLRMAYAEAKTVAALQEAEEKNRFARVIPVIRDLNDIRSLIQSQRYKQLAQF
jgi:hypothetical protein